MLPYHSSKSFKRIKPQLSIYAEALAVSLESILDETLHFDSQVAPDTVQIHSVVKKQPKSDVVCNPQWLPSPIASSALADGTADGAAGADGAVDGYTEAQEYADPHQEGNNANGRASLPPPPPPLPPGHTVIFADDSVSELLEHRVANHPQVVRVLFTRAR